MSYVVAVAGKGGTGKTTLCGFLIDYLCKSGKTPVLAVDADANSNLNEVLGVDPPATLGEIREEIAQADLLPVSPIPAGMSKADYMDSKFADALIEMEDYDLLAMGRTQGKGCYCFVNGLLQSQLSKYTGRYKYVVVDNEAGMEHISRGLLPQVDLVLLVSDCSRRGIQAVGRIAELIAELKLNPSSVKLIVNRAPGGELAQGIADEIRLQGLDLLGIIPHDNLLYEYDSEGRPTATLPYDSISRSAFDRIIKTVIQ